MDQAGNPRVGMNRNQRSRQRDYLRGHLLRQVSEGFYAHDPSAFDSVTVRIVSFD